MGSFHAQDSILRSTEPWRWTLARRPGYDAEVRRPSDVGSQLLRADDGAIIGRCICDGWLTLVALRMLLSDQTLMQGQ